MLLRSTTFKKVLKETQAAYGILQFNSGTQGGELGKKQRN